MSRDVVIIGAGLAGLACARHLGRPTRVLERAAEVGGTARTFKRGDFLFDVTGHWLHLRDERTRALVTELFPEGLLEVQRRAEIYSHGVRTPYPFQANTYGLPADVVAECVLGYFRAREQAHERPAPRSFEDFIRQRMGDGIAEHFMIPYNTKLWTVPPREMAHEWCGRFVPTPTPEEVVHGALRPAGAGHGLGYNATFLYPRAGGIGELARRLAKSCTLAQISTETEVVEVDWRQRRVRTNEGEWVPYGALVSTMPLNVLAERLVDRPAPIHDAARALRAADVTYWDLGFARPNGPTDAHWTYFPEPDVPFYRVGSASAAVPYLAPPGHRSLYVEVSHAQGTPCPVSDEHVLTALAKVGLRARDEQPVVAQRTTISGAYVIMDHAYGPAQGDILGWLRQQGIRSIGRYGGWTYDSMEGALVAGRAAALELA